MLEIPWNNLLRHFLFKNHLDIHADIILNRQVTSNETFLFADDKIGQGSKWDDNRLRGVKAGTSNPDDSCILESKDDDSGEETCSITLAGDDKRLTGESGNTRV